MIILKPYMGILDLFGSWGGFRRWLVLGGGSVGVRLDPALGSRSVSLYSIRTTTTTKYLVHHHH